MQAFQISASALTNTTELFIATDDNGKRLATARCPLGDERRRRAIAVDWTWYLTNGQCVTTDDIEQALRSAELALIESTEADDEPSKTQSQAALLIKISTDSAELFHTPGAVDASGAFADLHDGRIRRTVAVRSKEFRLWLGGTFFGLMGSPANTDTLRSAIETVSALCLFDSDERGVFLRTAGNDETIWLDLCDGEYRIIEITASGWTIRNSADIPARFIRRRGMRALPLPQRGGNLAELSGLLNLPDDDDWALLLAWLTAALRPTGPYPVLCVSGEQGSAKSTLCRIVRRLVDPNDCELRRPPRDERDLMIAAQNSWVVSLDNMSKLRDGLSDCLCTLATGGGFATRELYSDDDEKLFTAERPIMLNGISNVAVRGDLADRSIVLNLPTIPEHNRREEQDVMVRFEAIRPAILGTLLEAVVSGLQNLATVKLDRLPRMADFAKWAVACEPALGLAPGTFLSAYRANRSAGDIETVETAAIGPPLMELVRSSLSGRLSVTASELLEALVKTAGESKAQRDGWPRTPRGLAGQIRRLAPAMRACGVDIEAPKPADKKRIYRLTLQGPDSTALTAQPPENGPGAIRNADSSRAVDGRLETSDGVQPPQPPGNRPTENGPGAIENADSGRLGGMGGCVPPLCGAPPDDDDGPPLMDPETGELISRDRLQPVPTRMAAGLWYRQPDRDENGETALERAMRWQREQKAAAAANCPKTGP